jgi:predicted phage terminase large subunit-like protein
MSRKFHIEDFSDAELALLKARCETDFLTFCHIFFFVTTGRKWLPAPHHPIIAETLTRVTLGEITQLIINIPPRYGKTWFICVLWVAWNLAKFPWSRFLYTSYSDDLVLKSSRFVKDIMKTDLYQLFWPTNFRKDETAKKAWESEEEGGGLNAASVGGQITGFGAGVTGYDHTFSGAQLIDDPNKVQDAGSRLASLGVQRFYTDTFESRKEHRKVPTVVIQQRTCADDLSGFLLTEGAHGYWHHLMIPALIIEGDEYPAKYKHGIEIPHGLPPGPLWVVKHTEAELVAMRDNPITEFKFWSQYQMVPRVRGGGAIKAHWFGDYDRYDPRDGTIDGIRIVSKRVYSDTALEAAQHNDRSVFLCAGHLADGRVAILDLWAERVESPELLEAAKNFVYRHVFVANVTNIGLSALKVEKKASGHGLIQQLRKDREFTRKSKSLSIVPINRNVDKISRMHGVAPLIKAGKVLIPKNAPWRSDFIAEVTEFNDFGTAKHDDITDTLMDAVTDFCIETVGVDYDVYKNTR